MAFCNIRLFPSEGTYVVKGIFQMDAARRSRHTNAYFTGLGKTKRIVLFDTLLASQGLMLASPIFFYTVSAHTKILMDRCQSLWVKKYWIDKIPAGRQEVKRRGLFISVGATKGKKLFDGTLLSIRYFFDVLDTDLWKSLLYRQLDFEGDVLKQPQYLSEAYETGKQFVNALRALPKLGARNGAVTEN